MRLASLTNLAIAAVRGLCTHLHVHHPFDLTVSSCRMRLRLGHMGEVGSTYMVPSMNCTPASSQALMMASVSSLPCSRRLLGACDLVEGTTTRRSHYQRYGLLQQDVLSLGSSFLNPLKVDGCWQWDVDCMDIWQVEHFVIAALRLHRPVLQSLNADEISCCG